MEIEIKSLEIVMVDIDSLIINPKNNNTHPEGQIERLVKMYKYNGFRNPLTVSKRSGFVICGHGRIEAAKRLGMTKVPVMFQDFKDEASEYAHLTADNEIAKWAKTDLSLVNIEMTDFGPEFDIDMLGVNNFTIEPFDKLDLDDEPKDEIPVKHVLEITFPNEMEKMDIHDDLVYRGYIVKIK